MNNLLAAVALSIALPALAQDPKTPQLTREEQKLAKKATALNEQAFQILSIKVFRFEQ